MTQQDFSAGSNASADDLELEMLGLGDTPEAAKPAAPPSETARRLRESGFFDEEHDRHLIEQHETAEYARRQSSLFGKLGELDDTQRREAIKAEKDAAGSSISFWEGFKTKYKPSIDPALSAVGSAVRSDLQARADMTRKGASAFAPDSVFGRLAASTDWNAEAAAIAPDDNTSPDKWLARKTESNIAEARRRRELAEHMEQGLIPGPQFAQWRAKVDDLARGLGDVVGSVLKGAGYSQKGTTLDNLSDAEKTKLYQFGAFAEEKAKAMFPADPAREREFSTKLAEGAGSMIGFFGPTIAARVLANAGPKTMTVIAGGTGAMSQSDMVDDALKAYRKQAGLKDGPLSPADEQKLTTVWLASLGIGATEAASVARFFEGRKGSLVRATLAQMGEEGGQEFVQSVLENVTAQRMYDPNRQWDDGAWEGMAVGAILGAGMQVGQSGYGKVKEARAGGAKTKTDVSPETAPAATPGAAVPAPAPAVPAATPVTPAVKPNEGQAKGSNPVDADLAESQAMLEAATAPRPDLSPATVDGGGAAVARPDASSEAKAAAPDVSGELPAQNAETAPAAQDWHDMEPADVTAAHVRAFGREPKSFGQAVRNLSKLDPQEQADARGIAAEPDMQPVAKTVDPTVSDAAATVSGAAQPGVQATSAVTETAATGPTEAHRAAFADVLASKTKRSDWGKSIGADEATTNTLIQEAVADGRLILRNGRPIRLTEARTSAAKAQATSDAPAAQHSSRATSAGPADASSAAPSLTPSYAESRRLELVTDPRAQGYARDLLNARGDAGYFAGIVAKLKSDTKVGKAAADTVLRALTGSQLAQTSATKAQIIAAISAASGKRAEPNLKPHEKLIKPVTTWMQANDITSVAGVKPGETFRDPATGMELSRNDVTAIVDMWRYAQEMRKAGKPETLTAWLIRTGRVQDQGNELGTILGGKAKQLISSKGRTLDDAARAAWEEGFFSGERPTIREFLDALDEDSRGNPKIRAEDEQRAEDIAVARDMLNELDELGVGNVLTGAEIYDYFRTQESGQGASRGATPARGAEKTGQSKSKASEKTALADDVPFFAMAGERARTADHDALTRAKEQAARGVDRATIWSDTGWFQGVDGKWRFEISDKFSPSFDPDQTSGAELKHGAKAVRDLVDSYVFDTELQNVMQHPELFSAYPGAPFVSVKQMPGQGASYGYSIISMGRDLLKRVASPKSKVDIKRPTSVLLHETQHYIQELENFARGGSPGEFSEALVNQYMAEKASRPGEWTADWTVADTSSPDDPVMARWELYQRFAGEVEARAVQKRMDMTPEERKARPPWLDYDIAEAQQFVRFDGSEPKLSIAAPRRATLSIPGLKAPKSGDRPSTSVNPRRDIAMPESLAAELGYPAGVKIDVTYDHVLERHARDDVPAGLELDTDEKIRAHVEDVTANWAYAYRYQDGKTWTLVRPMKNGVSRVLAVRENVTRGAHSVLAPTAFVDVDRLSPMRMGKALDAFGPDAVVVKTGLEAKNATLTAVREAHATRHNPSLKRFTDGLAKRQEQDQTLAASIAGNRKPEPALVEPTYPADMGAELRVLRVSGERPRALARALNAAALDQVEFDAAVMALASEATLPVSSVLDVAVAYTGGPVQGDPIEAIRREFASRVHDLSLAEIGGFDPQLSGSNLAPTDAIVTRLEEVAARLPADIGLEVRPILEMAIGARAARRVMTELEGATITAEMAASQFNINPRAYKKIVAVSLAYGPETAMATFTHEEIHALRPLLEAAGEWKTLASLNNRKPIKKEALRLIEKRLASEHLTEAEADSLRARAGSLTYREIYQIDQRYKALGLQESTLVEEVIAHVAADWADGHDFGTRVERAMAKLWDLLEALGNALRGNGFVSVNSVFNSVWSGEVARRARDEASIFDGEPEQLAGVPAYAVRTQAQAAALLDRAASLGMFRAPFSLRGLFDRQMRAPGSIDAEPFDLSHMTAIRHGVQDVPVKVIKTIQKTVSVDAVKAKLADPTSDDGRPPSVFKYGNDYYVNDGNHRIVAAKALGESTIEAEVIELQDAMFSLSSYARGRSVGASQRADLDALGFYSKALEAAKAWPQAKGTLEQALTWLKKSGVKDGEIDATGVGEFLKQKAADRSPPLEPQGRSNEASRVLAETPDYKRAEDAAVKAYNADIRENETKYFSEHVDYDANGDRLPLDDYHPSLYRRDWANVVPAAAAAVEAGARALGFDLSLGGSVTSNSRYGTIKINGEAKKIRVADHERQSGLHDGADFNITPDTQTPLQFFEELVRLSQSTKSTPKSTFITRSDLVKLLKEKRVGLREQQYGHDPRHFEVNRLYAEGADRRARALQDEIQSSGIFVSKPKWHTFSLDPSNPTYRETVLHLPPPPKYNEDFKVYESAFRSGHFPEPNIFGHMMTSMTTHQGKAVYTIDQIQSDWGQKLRDGGVRDEAKIADLKSKSKSAEDKWIAFRDDAATFARSNGAEPNDFASTKAALTSIAKKSDNPEAVQGAENRLALWDEVLGDNRLLKAEYDTVAASVSGHPLVNTTDQWTNTTLRRAIAQAVDADADYIAIPHGDTVLSYNPGDDHGMRSFYGTRTVEGIVPKNLRKLLERLDKDAAKSTRVETVEVSDGPRGWKKDSTLKFDKSQTGFTLFPLTEKVKQSIRDDGQPMFAIAGQKAKGAPVSMIATAEMMETKGRTPAAILSATGWYRGQDQKWRFEIDDSAAKTVNLGTHIKTPAKGLFRAMLGKKAKGVPAWATGDVKIGVGVRLPDILKHDKLYRAYPFLKNMNVNVIVGKGVPADKEGGALVYRKADGKLIYSPIKVRATSEKDVLPILLHEIQHYIQLKEGFSTGSAPSTGKPIKPAKADFKRNTGGPKYPGKTFSANTVANQETVDRGPLIPMSRAETLALQLNDMHRAREAGQTWSTWQWTPNYMFGRNPGNIEDAIGRTQAELANLLTVTSEDYLNSVGEAEARAVETRLNMTPEQRRASIPDYGTADNPSDSGTFAEAADEVLRRASSTFRMREEQRKPVVIGEGITARMMGHRDDAIGILHKKYKEWGTTVLVALDRDNGRAIMSLWNVGRKDIGADSTDVDHPQHPAPLTDAEIHTIVDATEKYLRARNLTPTADVRLAPQGADVREDKMSPAEMRFWRSRDPYFMMDVPEASGLISFPEDYELHIGGVRYKPKSVTEQRAIETLSEYGGNFDQTLKDIKALQNYRRQGKSSRENDLDGQEQFIRSLMDMEADKNDALIEIKAGMEMPLDLQAANLDPEVWKVRTDDAVAEQAPQADVADDQSAVRNFNALLASADDSPRFSLSSKSRPTVKPADATLNTAIGELKDALGLTVTQGLRGLTVKAGNRSVTIKPKSNVRGQINRATGAISVRSSRDLKAIAHEGGHRLEMMLPEVIDALKAAHVEELMGPISPDLAMPNLNPDVTQFSGLDLDAVEQAALVDASLADLAHRRRATVSNAETDEIKALSKTAAVARGQLMRLVGATRADALVDGLRAQLAKGQTLPASALPEAARDALAAMVQTRFSASGTPRPRTKTVPEGNALSEGFANFMSTYIMDPDRAQTEHAKVFEAFEDAMEAEAPKMLGALHKVQDTYKAWLARATIEELSSDTVSVSSKNSIAQLAKDGSFENIAGKMSTAYTGLIDDLNPINKIQAKLIERADKNGVVDADGRPISLAVHENAYKIARMWRGAYATGYSWLMNGIPNHGSTEVQFRGLADAMQTMFGGDKWSEAGKQVLGQYLISQRAVAEYDRLEAKTNRLAQIDSLLERGGAAWSELTLARRTEAQKLERFETATVQSRTLMQDRRRALGVAQTVARDMEERLDEIRADIAEAQAAIDDGSDKARATKSRKQRSLSLAERNAVRARADVEALSTEFAELDVGTTLAAEQARVSRERVDGLDAQLRDLDAAVARLRSQRVQAERAGGSRAPTLEPKSFHEDVIRKAESDKRYPKIKEAAEIVREYAFGLLTIRHQAGLISDELYTELASRKDYYVPFMRDMSDVAPEDAFFGGGNEKWSPFKKYDGSDRAIINPLEALAQEAYATAQHIGFNESVGALAGLAEKSGPGSADIAEVIGQTENLDGTPETFARIRADVESLGIDPADAHMIVQRMEMNFANENLSMVWAPGKGPMALPSLPLWRGGQRLHVRLTDPEFGRDVFNAMSGLGVEMSDTFIKWAARPARLLQMGITTHPTFMPRNLFRDIVDAWIKVGAMPIITQAKGAAILLRDNDFVAKYQAAGGISGGRNIAALTQKEQQANVLELDPKHVSGWSVATGAVLGGIVGSTIAGPAGTMIGAALGGYGTRRGTVLKTVEAVETMTRLGVAAHAYKRAKEHNPELTEAQAMLEAAFVSRDVFDWNRRGSQTLSITRLVTFLNAQLQGLDKSVRALGGESDRGSALARQMKRVIDRETGVPLSKDEERALGESYKTFARLALYTLFLVSLYAIYRDDKRYQDIKDKTKFTHSWLPTAFGFDVRLPKAFEWAVPANIAEALWDKWAGRDPRAAERIAHGVYEVLTPPLIPQILITQAGFRTGVDMTTGRDIVAEHLRRLDPQSQFDAFASQLSIDVSRAMANAGVPRDKTPSPAMVDWTLRLGGYWGQDVTKAYRAVKEGLGGPQREAARIPELPILGGFTAIAARSSKSTEELWKLFGFSGGKLTSAANTYADFLKTGRPGEAAGYMLRLEPEERAYATLKYHFGAGDNRLHPLERLNAVDKISRNIRKELILDRLGESEKVGNKTVFDASTKITLSPQKQTEIHDILERYAQAEAWNTMVLLKRPGWEGKSEFATKPILDELKASNKKVFEIFQDRLDKSKAETFEDVRREWPKMRPKLLRDGANARL